MCFRLDEARGLVCLSDPKSYAGGDFVCPGRFYQAGQVKGERLD